MRFQTAEVEQAKNSDAAPKRNTNTQPSGKDKRAALLLDKVILLLYCLEKLKKRNWLSAK